MNGPSRTIVWLIEEGYIICSATVVPKNDVLAVISLSYMDALWAYCSCTIETVHCFTLKIFLANSKPYFEGIQLTRRYPIHLSFFLLGWRLGALSTIDQNELAFWKIWMQSIFLSYSFCVSHIGIQQFDSLIFLASSFDFQIRLSQTIETFALRFALFHLETWVCLTVWLGTLHYMWLITCRQSISFSSFSILRFPVSLCSRSPYSRLHTCLFPLLCVVNQQVTEDFTTYILWYRKWLLKQKLFLQDTQRPLSNLVLHYLMLKLRRGWMIGSYPKDHLSNSSLSFFLFCMWLFSSVLSNTTSCVFKNIFLFFNLFVSGLFNCLENKYLLPN